jgi:hypothetical protein
MDGASKSPGRSEKRRASDSGFSLADAAMGPVSLLTFLSKESKSRDSAKNRRCGQPEKAQTLQ